MYKSSNARRNGFFIFSVRHVGFSILVWVVQDGSFFVLVAQARLAEPEGDGCAVTMADDVTTRPDAIPENGEQ